MCHDPKGKAVKGPIVAVSCYLAGVWEVRGLANSAALLLCELGVLLYC